MLSRNGRRTMPPTSSVHAPRAAVSHSGTSSEMKYDGKRLPASRAELRGVSIDVTEECRLERFILLARVVEGTLRSARTATVAGDREKRRERAPTAGEKASTINSQSLGAMPLSGRHRIVEEEDERTAGRCAPREKGLRDSDP